jgi:hypothetical protein
MQLGFKIALRLLHIKQHGQLAIHVSEIGGLPRALALPISLRRKEKLSAKRPLEEFFEYRFLRAVHLGIVPKKGRPARASLASGMASPPRLVTPGIP